MAAKKPAKKVMKEKKAKAPVIEAPMDWKFNAAKTHVKKSLSFENAIAALAFAAKITVHASIFKIFPELTIREGELTITICAAKETLSKEELALAARVDSLERGM